MSKLAEGAMNIFLPVIKYTDVTSDMMPPRPGSAGGAGDTHRQRIHTSPAESKHGWRTLQIVYIFFF